MSKSKNRTSAESILERAQRVKDKVSRTTEKLKDRKASSQRKKNTTASGGIAKFLYSLHRAYSKFLAPAIGLILIPLASFFRLYNKLWTWFVFKGKRNEFSKTRATVFSTLTCCFLLALTPTKIGNFIRFFTVEPLVDSSLMLISMNEEEYFLNHSEEIDPEGNVHSVRGCINLGACGEQEAAYFRIKPRLSHDVWKLIKYGDPVYIPDHVVAPIAPGVNRCSVVYYGYRITSSWISRLMRSLQIYPIMLEANCQHVGQNLPTGNYTTSKDTTSDLPTIEPRNSPQNQ